VTVNFLFNFRSRKSRLKRENTFFFPSVIGFALTARDR